MRFIGYCIKKEDGSFKKFGAGQREEAEKAAKENKTEVKLWIYKI